jgi:hypothetical protein
VDVWYSHPGSVAAQKKRSANLRYYVVDLILTH